MTGSIYYYDQLYKQNIDWFCFIVVQTFMLRNIYVNFIENHNTSLKIVIVDGFILSIKRHLQFSHHYFIIIFVSVSTKTNWSILYVKSFTRGEHFVISPVFQCYKTWIRYFFLFLNSIWICIFNCFKFLIVLAKYQYEISLFKLLNLVV